MGGDGIQLVSEIVDIYENFQFETGVLAASFRNLQQIKDVALA